MQPVFISRHSSIEPDGTVTGLTKPAVEPDYKSIITDATLRRRMSRFVKMGVACGLQCIGETPASQIDAIITATGLGCLADTEKFLDSIIANNERLLNPTPFIQSTFNTVGGQIALLKSINAYNVTYVHRGLSFESALTDAAMQICDGARNVLVGAIDEATDSATDIQQRLGLLKEHPLGEGSHFFMLNANDKSAPAICDIGLFNGNADNIKNKIDSFIQHNNLKLSDLDCVITSDSSMLGVVSNGKTIDFKAICGDYQTSTAFALNMAAQEIEKGNAGNILISNSYQNISHSLILVRRLK